jgi:hypothetical protein
MASATMSRPSSLVPIFQKRARGDTFASCS